MIESLGQGVYYTLKDKPFWAAFLNLARHNVYVTINHINQKVGIPPIGNDEHLLQICNFWRGEKIDNDLLKKGKLQELILKHFPFITAAAYGEKSYEVYNELEIDSKTDKKRNKKLKDKQKEQSEALSLDVLVGVLEKFFKKLKELRNYYSHHNHPDSPSIPIFDTDILNRLYNVFDANIRLVKEDHKANGKIDVKKDFNHLIRKDKNGDNKDFKHHFREKNEITEYGLLFFVSLFLEKRDAIWMQKKIRGLKGGDEGFKQMTNEVFCRSRMLLPQLKLESVYDGDQMLLDMLNELGRCPKSLFDRLKDDDREKFRVPLEQLDNEENEADEDPFKNTLIRHQDRFPYFALRYFDWNEILPSLRFQVDLGNYHFDIYDKQIGDFKEKRHLTRNLYGFDRIQNFTEEKQPEKWKSLVKDLDYYESADLPFISKTTPHYHLEANRIGLKFIQSNENNSLYPPLETEDKANVRKRYKYDTHFVSEAFMSVHELAPMMFYYLLVKSENPSEEPQRAKDRAGNKTEGVLKQTQKNIFEVFDKFEKGEINTIGDLERHLNGKNLLAGHLPDQMLSILKNVHSDMKAQALRKTAELIEDTQRRREKLDEQIKQKIRIGKRNSGLLKSGIIADWLMQDLMRFQPVAYDSEGKPLNRSKANSTEYQLLQRTFALFGGEKDRLPAYLRQMNLIGSSNPHPFLSNFDWDKQPNIMAFYEQYLNKRLDYLQKLNADDWEKHQYFLMLKVPKTNRKTLVAGWKNGFNLPRGLFTEPIKKWFADNANKNDKLKALNQKVQTTYRAGFIPRVIPLYFETIHQDSSQEFYDFAFNIGDPKKPQKGNYPSREKRKEIWDKNKNNFSDKAYHKWLQTTENKIKTFFKGVRCTRIDDKKVKIREEEQDRIKDFLFSIDLLGAFKKDIKEKINIKHLEKQVLEALPKLLLDFKAWQKFEKERRLVRNQDILMWLMCKDLHNNTMVEQLQIYDLFLKNIKVDVSNRGQAAVATNSLNILNRVVPMKLPIITYEAEDKGNVLKNRPTATFYIEEANTKVLKQGNFKALVKDRRLNGLLSFVNTDNIDLKTNTIKKVDLQHELGRYQTIRIEIFQLTLELEKLILDKYSHLPANNFRKMMEEWLKTKPKNSSLEKAVNISIAVRNAFSHNQYPMHSEELLGEKPYKLQDGGQMGIAEKIKEETLKAIDEIRNNL